MPKKMKKKKKLKLLPFLIFLLVIFFVGLLVKFALDSPIKNIFIYDNKLLSDQEIIDMAGLSDYPSFLRTTSLSIRKKLLKNELIEDVKVTKWVYNKVSIYVKEKDVLFINKDEKIVLSDKSEVSDINVSAVPRLLNYVPDTIYDKFIKGMKKINPNIRKEISEIEYSPNNYDESRFLLYMDDGNYVYLTLTKFDRLNYYNEVYATLGNKKGILYLDSGNHFKIMK